MPLVIWRKKSCLRTEMENRAIILNLRAIFLVKSQEGQFWQGGARELKLGYNRFTMSTISLEVDSSDNRCFAPKAQYIYQDSKLLAKG